METNRENSPPWEQPPAKAGGWHCHCVSAPRSTLEKSIARRARSGLRRCNFDCDRHGFCLMLLPSENNGPQRGATAASIQYYSQEDQQKFLAAQETGAVPASLYTWISPGRANYGIWLAWFYVGSVLHLTLTRAGSPAQPFGADLAAWSMLPLGLRYIVRMIQLSTRQWWQERGYLD